MNAKSIYAGFALISVLNIAAAQTGFAGKAQPKAVPPAGGGTVVAGLPNIKGTTLGFIVKQSVPWGGSTVVDQPLHIKQTQAGPNKDLCVITTALYRTFNQGDFTVGSFIDIVYRNGTPIHTRHVASLAPGTSFDFEHKDLPFQEGMNVIQVKMDANNDIAESDENNAFEIKVTVNYDCNGDGNIAGVPGHLKGASPTPPAQKTPASIKSR